MRDNAAISRRWRERHPDQFRQIVRRWRAAHPNANIAAAHRWRARKRLAQGTYTRQEWLDKVALLGGVCFYCGERRPLAGDHAVPLSRGGSNDIGNILPACKPCNSRKGARTAREFLVLRESRV